MKRPRSESSKPEPSATLALPGLAVCLLLVAASWSAPVEAQRVDAEAWIEARSADFLLRSDADPQRVEDIARTLQIFRSAFASLAPEFELHSPVPTLILAFRDEESFGGFKSGQENSGSRILGQFLTHPDGNFITLNADPRLLGGVGVVLHEYVHYLVAHNFPGVPRWFNEGLAEYYSTFALAGDRAIIGRPVERHLGWLRRHGRVDIAEILEAGRSGNRHSEVDAGHFYAVSWGLVHYLLSAPELSSQLALFLADAGHTTQSARFEDVFDLRLEELEEDLLRYLLTDEPPAGSLPLEALGNRVVSVVPAAAADVLNDLGSLLVRLGEEDGGGRYFDLALAYEPEHGDALAGLAHARELGQRFEEADLLFAQALDAGLEEPRSYVLFGRHLLRRLEEAGRAAKPDEASILIRQAKSAFRAATGLKPDYAEAWALLGALHLFGGLETADGIPHLERALELLPGRVDLFFRLLQLEVRSDGHSRARALAEGPIRRLGGEEWGLRADEEIERIGYLRRAEAALREGRLEEGRTLLETAIAITTEADLRERLQANLDEVERRADERNGSELE